MMHEKELTKKEKINLGTKEIAKRIRKQLKKEFPDCKFSVRIKRYSGGSSITVSFMKADRKVKMDFDKIPQGWFNRYLDIRSIEDLRKLQNEDYHQLNQHTLKQEYGGHWCNGVFLTRQGHLLLKRVVQIADYYNYDDSDMMTDYYSVNFSFNIQLGKWDKPFIDGEGFKVDKQLEENIKQRQEQILA
ncbi:hypothetical protein AKJ59_00630 [candidate division MSBL1 archaeon SCGC-AAA385M02]|uniref:Large polyvalent protein associated domain-containing protein n=1 Tax=candidate division MSBL1 archaeon SCGC-AAA385M02 TaxID=1698287 RepID=A0A133VQE9_9EURY|nr:hypothetical protein AKJ59_00630 [candidate division MSBL1 archaeon SCGC-AAA385M02]